MNQVEFFVIMTIALIALVLGLYYLLVRSKKKILWLHGHRKHPLDIDYSRLDEINHSLQDCHIIERLYIMRTLLGSSYRCMIKVSSRNLVIEQCQLLDLDEDEPSDDRLKEMTG